MSEILEKILKQMNEQGDGWATANKPFTAPLETTISQKVTRVSTDIKTMKELKGIKTGTFLDVMFLDANDKPIDGIPIASNSILTGLPNSGKSLIMNEIALKMANDGKKVALILSEEIFRAESERYDLETRLREKAKLLGLNWNKIAKNLFVIDTVTNAELRDWSNFVTVYRNLAETDGIDIMLVDSLTLLEDVRGQIKYRVLELMRYNQTHGITSIMISQRSIEEADTLAIAGGIGLSHIVDTVFILDYKKISSWDGQIKLDIPDAKQGAVQNFFRIVKCRLCRFNARYFGYEITKDGFVRLYTEGKASKAVVEIRKIDSALSDEVIDGEIISGFPAHPNKKKTEDVKLL